MREIRTKAWLIVLAVVAFIGAMLFAAICILRNKRGENFLDSGFKILIVVVIASLFLAGLYTLFGDVIMPTLTNRVQDLFNYNG
jgi:lipopolysaccharide export LptBFGC system permease protein LptF